jgi:hypothetical protein
MCVFVSPVMEEDEAVEMGLGRGEWRRQKGGERGKALSGLMRDEKASLSWSVSLHKHAHTFISGLPGHMYIFVKWVLTVVVHTTRLQR